MSSENRPRGRNPVHSRRLLSIAITLALPFWLQAAGAQDVPAVSAPTQIKVLDDRVGAGPEIRPGRFAVMHYTGWVYDQTAPDGKGHRFVSSRERGEPLSYVYGYGRALRGLERGMQGMHAGGVRTIVIPPKLGYDDFRHPNPPDVPVGSALVFEVELLDVVPQSAPPDQ